MPTINIEANVSVETLVKAAEQLSTPDLQEFRSQVLAISARRAASSVSQDEAQCLLQISQRLPADLQQQYDELIAKRDAETLTAEEHARLLQLSQHAEALDVERVEALTKLAQVRGVTLSEVLKQLKIDQSVGSVKGK
jgi:hypothetical protein